MENDAQLHNLAKRLINIYNTCKWSQTKLYLRKKKSKRKKINEISPTRKERIKLKLIKSNSYSQISNYNNDLSVNICTCRSCCCANKTANYEKIHKYKKPIENKDSKILICIKPRKKDYIDMRKNCYCSTTDLTTNFFNRKSKNPRINLSPKNSSDCCCGAQTESQCCELCKCKNFSCQYQEDDSSSDEKIILPSMYYCKGQGPIPVSSSLELTNEILNECPPEKKTVPQAKKQTNIQVTRSGEFLASPLKGQQNKTRNECCDCSELKKNLGPFCHCPTNKPSPSQPPQQGQGCCPCGGSPALQKKPSITPVCPPCCQHSSPQKAPPCSCGGTGGGGGRPPPVFKKTPSITATPICPQCCQPSSPQKEPPCPCGGRPPPLFPKKPSITATAICPQCCKRSSPQKDYTEELRLSKRMQRNSQDSEDCYQHLQCCEGRRQQQQPQQQHQLQCCGGKNQEQEQQGADGDHIPGVNDDTKGEIKLLLTKIDRTLTEESDCHCRNLRCIMDQLRKQAGDIKELKVLAKGVGNKKAPSCKDVEDKIKKLTKSAEKEQVKRLEKQAKERGKTKKAGKKASGSCCCTCDEEEPLDCCGECCANRCCGCCRTCCGGCCPRCCDMCCPCQKCCNKCCCACATCCDDCLSCKCFRRKKKCKCVS